MSSGIRPAARGRAPLDPRDELGIGHHVGVHFGLHEPRHDAVHLHVERRDLHGKRARQHPQRTLAGRVGDDSRPAEIGGERAHVDDLAAAPRLHAGQDRARDQERAIDVRGLDFPPCIQRHRIQRCADIEGGIVDENVDAAVALLDRADAARRPRRHRRRRTPAPRRRVLRRASSAAAASSLRGIAAVQHDPRTGSPERPRDPEPQPGAAPGHQRNAVAQIKRIVHGPLRVLGLSCRWCPCASTPLQCARGRSARAATCRDRHCRDQHKRGRAR